tara:strand:- start:5993 stop:6157 length:165 start_codon:yes stop_codon:yes gene_type:complete
MYSGRRSGAVFVKNEATQEAYADYFENNNNEIKKKNSSGGILRYLLNYFSCFST